MAEVEAVKGLGSVIGHHEGGIVGLAGFLGVDTLDGNTPVFQQGRRRFLGHGDFFGGEELVVLPQTEATAIGLTEEALFALGHIPTATRAFADDLTTRGKQNFRTLYGGVGLYQIADHAADLSHKLIGIQFAMLHQLQLVFPFGCKQRRLELFGQNRNEGHARTGRNEADILLGFPTLHKSRGNELFNDTGTSGRRTQAFSLGIIGHFLCTGDLHCREQRVLGEVSRRLCHTFLDFRTLHIQLITIMEFGQHLVGLFFFVVDFPACIYDCLALGGKYGISKGNFSYGL